MASDHPPPSGFLSRWSQRKVRAGQGQPLDEPPPVPAAPSLALPAGADADPPVVADAAAGARTEAAKPAEPAPTLADVAQLGIGSDYRRFVGAGVDVEVKNAALKQLFTDPHFNVMDGLDTYIDDYGRPDPLPAGMLRQLAQGQFVGLFSDEAPAAEAPVTSAATVTATTATTATAAAEAAHPATVVVVESAPSAPSAADENPDL